MKDNEITITETLAEIEKHRTEYAIRREEEEGYVNHSYRDEQILMQTRKWRSSLSPRCTEILLFTICGRTVSRV